MAEAVYLKHPGEMEVRAMFEVWLSFRVPKGLTLRDDFGEPNYWVKYGRLHIVDESGVEHIVGPEPTDLDLKHPEEVEVSRAEPEEA